MIWIIGLTVAAVVMLIVGEWFGSSYRRAVKAAASTGFLGVALAAGAVDSRYGSVMLVGFVLAWIGDLSLTFEARRAFVGGLVAFLFGHIAYVVAFSMRGFRWPVVLTTAAIVAVAAILVWRWLRPHLDGPMVGPVAGYVVVISLMVGMAAGTRDLQIVGGAVLFFLSDLFVARQRFVAPGFANRLVGLPLYYAGQVLLALSVG